MHPLGPFHNATVLGKKLSETSSLMEEVNEEESIQFVDDIEKAEEQYCNWDEHSSPFL